MCSPGLGASHLLNLLLLAARLEYLRTIAFIVVIAAIVQFTEMVIHKTSPVLYRALGIYLPLITTNCAVLGVPLLNAQQRPQLCRGAAVRPGQRAGLRWCWCCLPRCASGWKALDAGAVSRRADCAGDRRADEPGVCRLCRADAMSGALLTLAVLVGLGLLLGALLGFAAVRFKVDGDPLVDKIDAILPQTQCGQCGHPGCRPYATAIAAGEADIN